MTDQPMMQGPDGDPWHFGAHPRKSKVGDGRFKVFGDIGTNTRPDPIPRDEWKNTPDPDLSPYTDHFLIDQGAQNSCAGASGTGLFMGLRKMLGYDDVLLSHAVPYALANGGRDQGAAVDDVLDALCEHGTCPADVIDPYSWNGYKRRTWPKDWKERCRPYRVLEWLDCPTYEHTVTAAKFGFFCALGVRWQGGGGHAIFGTRYNSQTDEWTIKNSWKGYGRNGLGELPGRQVERGHGIFGNWAVRAVVDPKKDGDIRTNHN